MSEQDGTSSRRSFIARGIAGVGAVGAAGTAAAGKLDDWFRRLPWIADDPPPIARPPLNDPPLINKPITNIIDPPPLRHIPMIDGVVDDVEFHLSNTEGMLVQSHQVDSISAQDLADKTREAFCATMDTIEAWQTVNEAESLDEYLETTLFPFSELPVTTQVKMRQNFASARQEVREAFQGESGTETNTRDAVIAGVEEAVCFP